MATNELMDLNELRDVKEALARALASRRVDDQRVEEVARQLTSAKRPIRRIDVCTVGICIDFFIDGDQDGWSLLPELVNWEGGKLKGVEVFPWGIVKPDLLQVRVTQDFEGLAPVRE